MSDAIFFLAPAFVACLVIAGIHVYLGMHILVREVIFVDLSLAQLAALGATVAAVLEFSHQGLLFYLTAFAFTIVGAAIFTYTRHVRLNLSQEAIVGVVYAVASALMVLMLSHAPHGAEHIKNILVGYLLFTTWDQVIKITIIYAVLGLVQWIFARQFIRFSWNPETITSEPLAKWWDFFFYILLGVAITLSVQVAGVLLVFSFLIVPAVITRLFSENLGMRLALGWVIAAVASIMGLAASWHWDLPTGATIIAALGVLLIIAIVVRTFWRSPDTP